MSYSQHDFYNDDPAEVASSSGKRKLSSILAFLLLLVGGTYFVQTTLAANINLNSGPVEFGQGITQTTACSGATNLTISPNETFTNASGGGAFYFSSVTVSNIPVGCYGKDFIIRAYGNTGNTALAIFNTTSTDAVVYNDSGTFQSGPGMTGATVSSGSGTFTVTFTSPVALASSVFKVTVESRAGSTVIYNVGDFGPGGGRIFYKDLAGFDCGPTFSSTGSPSGGKCNYLEAAPSLWNGGAGDPAAKWANNTSQWVGTYGGSTETATAIAIGSGYRNTLAIIRAGNSDTGVAAALADSHTVTVGGVTFTDWYLPSINELAEMRVRRSSIGGFFDTTNDSIYWSSSEGGSNNGSRVRFNLGDQAGSGKGLALYVRPIRAF